MKKLNNIKNNILSVVGTGDILLIIPPFTTNTTALGPHILQAVGNEQGYKTDVLYVNLLLSSLIGFDFVENLGTSELFHYWSMLNERLFARSAYDLPPLGLHPEFCTNEAMSTNGFKKKLIIDYEQKKVNLDDFFEIEKTCSSFINIVADTITRLSYKIIGCTAHMGQTNCSIALLNKIKEHNPDVITIIGGANCQNDMAEGMASLSDSVDYVFSGESEKSFADFLTAFSADSLPKERVITGEPLENLDDIPLIDYADYFTQLKLFSNNKSASTPYIWYETSRGCHWGQKQRCTFCSRNNDSIRFRQKSKDKILDELQTLKRLYGDVKIATADNHMPLSFYKDILPELAAGDEYPACYYYVRGNITLKNIIALKKAGVERIIPGIEAFSTGLLKKVNKGVAARTNVMLLRNARSVGLNVFYFMLWGVPGDSVDYYRETLRILPLIRHLHPPHKFIRVHLERFADYCERPDEYGITNLKPYAVYSMIYPEWADIDKLAFGYSADYACDAYSHPELIREIAVEISRWQEMWKDSLLAMVPMAGFYIIYDKRKLPGTKESHVVDYDRAQEIMKYAIYENSDAQQWAVEQKLGVVIDSWYVPLVVAQPQVLLTLENDECLQMIR